MDISWSEKLERNARKDLSTPLLKLLNRFSFRVKIALHFTWELIAELSRNALSDWLSQVIFLIVGLVRINQNQNKWTWISVLSTHPFVIRTKRNEWKQSYTWDRNLYLSSKWSLMEEKCYKKICFITSFSLCSITSSVWFRCNRFWQLQWPDVVESIMKSPISLCWWKFLHFFMYKKARKIFVDTCNSFVLSESQVWKSW